MWDITDFSPFNVINDFNSLTPLNLINLPVDERISRNGYKKNIKIEGTSWECKVTY